MIDELREIRRGHACDGQTEPCAGPEVIRVSRGQELSGAFGTVDTVGRAPVTAACGSEPGGEEGVELIVEPTQCKGRFDVSELALEFPEAILFGVGARSHFRNREAGSQAMEKEVTLGAGPAIECYPVVTNRWTIDVREERVERGAPEHVGRHAG